MRPAVACLALLAACAEAATPGPESARSKGSASAVPPASSPAPVASAPEVPTVDVRDLPAASAAPLAGGPKRAVKVAAIGDSLTDDRRGVGGYYLKYLREKCPESRFDNFGKGGDMVNQMRKRFGPSVLGEGGTKTDYTHVIVFGGVNDLYSDETAGRGPKKVQADLLTMYQGAHGRGMKVVAITIAPWGGFKKWFTPKRGGYTRTVNTWIKEQVVAKNVDFVIDAHSLLSCGIPDMLCPKYAGFPGDGLHFDKNGQKVLGEALHEQVFKDCR